MEKSTEFAPAASSDSTLEATLQELYGFRRFGMRPGLDNIAALLEFCDRPQDELTCIHVAGTNGKGSVSSIIASVLQEAGHKVGLYTSPHILEFSERIRVNGAQISDSAIAAYAQRLMPEARRIGATFFETTTAMALRHFADSDVDVVVLETGLGGRLDSTNVVQPIMSIITSISRDHIGVLGDDLEIIAAEKAAIIKAATIAISGVRQPDLQNVIARRSREVGAELFQVDYRQTPPLTRISADLTMSVDLQIGAYQLRNLQGLPVGKHFVDNLRTALTALAQLNIWQWDSDIIRRAIKNLRVNTGLRGRFEILGRDTGEEANSGENPGIVLLDVAHNTAAFVQLRQTLELAGQPPHRFDLITAMMQDKEIDLMLAAVRPFVRRVFAVELPNNERAAAPADICRSAKQVGYEEAYEVASVGEAMANIKGEKRDALAAGSFFLAEEVLRWHNRQSRA